MFDWIAANRVWLLRDGQARWSRSDPRRAVRRRRHGRRPAPAAPALLMNREPGGLIFAAKVVG